jgi:hypothetical protein
LGCAAIKYLFRTNSSDCFNFDVRLSDPLEQLIEISNNAVDSNNDYVQYQSNSTANSTLPPVQQPPVLQQPIQQPQLLQQPQPQVVQKRSQGVQQTVQIEKRFQIHKQQSKKDSTTYYDITHFSVLDSPKPMSKPEDLLSPGRTNIPSRQGKFSNPFSNNGQCLPHLIKVMDPLFFPQLKRGWSVGNMAVVSNGNCGSTCGCFVRYVQTPLV